MFMNYILNMYLPPDACEMIKSMAGASYHNQRPASLTLQIL